jgi:hypothetical protein
MTYIGAALRRLVTERAANCCEYCRLRREDDLLPFAIDHIISEKHNGPTDADNLCLSCYHCNSFKGSDVAAADPQTGIATFLFHPRRQKWDEHFQLKGAIIEPLTPEARATVFVLRLNIPERVRERSMAIRLKSYPC